VLRNPRPRPDAITSAYAHDHYGEERMATLFEAHRALYRPRALRLDAWLAPGVGRGGRVRALEVGSYVGGFLAPACALGWDVRGVDPGEEVDRFCRARGLPVERTTLDALAASGAVPPASLDCVAIWNTFDQLPDPAPTLRTARRLLRDGGVLALRVPSGRCFRLLWALCRRAPAPLARLLHVALAWNNLLAFPYLHGHSPSTLDRLLARHGFARIAVVPDTLVPLADAKNARWARLEERAIKSAQRALARLFPGEELPLSPWFDAYYRAA
jgi:SAM-dependent methyltransferase